MDDNRILAAIARSAQRLRDGAGGVPLIERRGAARFVLLGEATHGTREFYRARAAITESLVRNHGFGAVAVEADWPDTDRVNRFLRGLGTSTAPAPCRRSTGSAPGRGNRRRRPTPSANDACSMP